ncbi:MAG: hypothetical protein JWM64_2403, partial [Frankiales bacterium]|nr:hypothetical protein [Frankiales bacterium]
LVQALAAAPRALVLLPVDYRSLLPYLRLAHDREVPVVVVDEPTDPENPTFVVAFVGADPVAQAARLAPLLGPGPVQVVGGQGSARGRLLAAALRARLPGRVVREQTSPAGTTGSVVLAEAGPVPPTAAGVRVLSAVLTASVTDALRAGRLVAAVAPPPCRLLREGVRLAAAAARNDPSASSSQQDLPSSTVLPGALEPPC